MGDYTPAGAHRPVAEGVRRQTPYWVILPGTARVDACAVQHGQRLGNESLRPCGACRARHGCAEGCEGESAALLGDAYGQALLDIVKCFEKVPHVKLADAARRHGYCLWTLRLTLAAYRAPRSVGINGAYSTLIVASCGITAGAGHATTELKVLLYDLILDSYKCLRFAKLILYVDDLTVQVTAPAAMLSALVARATDWVVTYFQDVLDLEVSAKKSNCRMLYVRSRQTGG